MVLYAIIILALSILSYTQVDLNLTLINWQPYLSIQSTFTQLGYFNRPLNLLLWTLAIAVLILSYYRLVQRANNQKLSTRSLVVLISLTALITLFSYTVFSHDIFNYIFDARIITHYGLNPYQYRALDFPQDDWTRFMQWTHRTYPYGPGWLAITAVPSTLGLGKFLPTYLLFKLLFAVSYLAVSAAIFQIAKLQNSNPALAVALFAFHPLVILDGLISPRIDMVMIAFALWGVVYLLRDNNRSAIATLLISASIKFASILFLPILWLNPSDHKKLFSYLFAAAVLGMVAQSIYSMTIQPWYFLLPLAVLPFMLPYYSVNKTIAATLIAIAPIWVYLYFISTGSWLPVI